MRIKAPENQRGNRTGTKAVFGTSKNFFPRAGTQPSRIQNQRLATEDKFPSVKNQNPLRDLLKGFQRTQEATEESEPFNNQSDGESYLDQDEKNNKGYFEQLLQDEGLKINIRKQIFEMERRFKRNETKQFRLRGDREILEDLAGSIGDLQSRNIQSKANRVKKVSKKRKKAERNQKIILNQSIDQTNKLDPKDLEIRKTFATLLDIKPDP